MLVLWYRFTTVVTEFTSACDGVGAFKWREVAFVSECTYVVESHVATKQFRVIASQDVDTVQCDRSNVLRAGRNKVDRSVCPTCHCVTKW